MSLHDAIYKATLLDTCTEKKNKFYRLKGLSQAKKDRKMNDRKVPVPKNLNIIEESCIDTNTTANCETNMPHSKVNLKNEISAYIKEVDGGQDFSNKCFVKEWEENIRKNKNNTIEEEHSQSLSDPSTCSNSPEVSNWSDNYCGTHKHKFLKNAALMGLVRCNIISVEDLIYPSYENVSSLDVMNRSIHVIFAQYDCEICKFCFLEDSIVTMHKYREIIQNISSDYRYQYVKLDKREEENVMYDYEYQMEALPHKEDPDVFVHPLQMGLDKKQYQHIDFSLPRITKKKRITPQEHYLATTDETFFDFVKR